MSQFITHNNKRYEVMPAEAYPIIGELGYIPITGQVITIENQAEVDNRWIRRIEEIPIFTDHTLSSIMINTDRLREDKENRRTFTRIRLGKEDFAFPNSK